MTDKTHPRLPCRGCTIHCKNYSDCNGKPWRIDKKPKNRCECSVVIFGGNGFIGSKIAELFVERGYEVTCVSRTGVCPAHFKKRNDSWINKIRWLKGDVGNPDRSLIESSSIVITAVGSPPLPTLTRSAYNSQYKANGGANLKLIEMCSELQPPQLVIVGACIPKLLQRSWFAYASGKQDVVKYAKTMAKNTRSAVTIIQPSMVYGRRHTTGGTPIPLGFLKYPSDLIRNIVSKHKHAFLHKLAQISPVSIDNVAASCLAATTKKSARGQVLIISNRQILQR